MTERGRSGNPLWIAYETVAMVIGLGSLALICLGWLPFALLLQPLLPQRWAQPIGRGFITRGFRFYLRLLEIFCACRFDLQELDRLRDSGPLIVAANHPSLLDAVMIVSRLPNAVCVMKASLMDNLLFGAAARLARYIRNDAPLDPCSPSTGLVANRARVPVQTVLIEFSTPYLGKAWPLFRRPQLPLSCRIRLGRRFEPPSNVQAFTAEIEAYFRAELGENGASPAPASA